ncbi:probable trehalose-phosphate phosphatase F [Cucurbita maxima]|uniref:Trehalose 6-phosphate phosphatase n=1 Tax=Cucurbita maxima TaxID=3661 RepID=A0A6J1HQ05_CUCMA|nr:probable trehalose-phosphate phosphatase F [Cucurbita maxima]XP_022965073.1 probable trehalose-phosphate phosphatase F [Cucurbita maxima]XP_022965074.1 probable trehalose-phosphate phosphatase F [Cucurbita maxima]
MDMTSNHASPVLTEPAPMNKSRLGIHSAILPYSQPGASFPPSKYIPIPRKKSGKFDDVWSNGWLDAMKSSSPPRKKIKDFDAEFASDDDTDVAYSSWVLKHPSALGSLEQITSYARNKKIAVFLDYDGTLSPIVDDPDCALMSNTMRFAVRNVAKYFPTAIISGRKREKVFDLVGLTELYYAGSHGMDIVGPVSQTVLNSHPNCTRSTDHQGKDVNLFQPAREFLPMIDEVFGTLVEKTKDIRGAKVENHKFCAAVHYRNVHEKNWPTIAQCVHDVLKDHPRLRLTHGRKVLEIRPVFDWNKGKAVEFLLESLGLNASEDVLPIYIGDDRTDEDAFKVLRERNQGYGILVSSVPKETNAFYSLRDPPEVMEFLMGLVGSRKVEKNT